MIDFFFFSHYRYITGLIAPVVFDLETSQASTSSAPCNEFISTVLKFFASVSLKKVKNNIETFLPLV